MHISSVESDHLRNLVQQHQKLEIERRRTPIKMLKQLVKGNASTAKSLKETVSASSSTSHAEIGQSTTAQKVFSTVELLEMILLQLSMKRLFIVQRVNTTFHDTIKDSIRLRRKMFLEEDPSYAAKDKQLLNPFLYIVAFQPKAGLFLELITKYRSQPYRSLEYWTDFKLPFFTAPSSPRNRLRDKIWFGHVRQVKKKKYLKLPRRKDVKESWQRMLLKQGRVARSSVRLWYKTGKKAWPLDYAKERFPTRVTLGEVWEFIDTMH